MGSTELSKSSAFNTAPWQPDYPVHWRCANERFAVAEWHCDGRGSAPPQAEEVTRYFEVNLHRHGWHVRSTARRQYFIDPLHHSLWPAGSGFRLSGNAAHRQAATLLFMANSFVEELVAILKDSGGSTLRRLHAAPTHWRSSELTLDHAMLLATEPGDVLALEENALALLRRVLAETADCRDSAVKRICSRQAAAADKARSFILSNYREPLSLSSIAAAAAVAPSTLCEIFPRVVGLPVWRYVRRLRLHAAALALSEGMEDLSGLALELGFSSHSHFAQAFRAEFNQAPSRFRCRTRR